MKSTTVALGFLAGLASAGSFNHHRRHPNFHGVHYRRDNATASASAAADAQTTLTVAITRTYSVISCAPTVTNCPAANNTAALSNLPASALTTVVVTNVVDLTTTVCPVTAAESISSKVVDMHNSGSIAGTTHSAGASAYPTATSANSPVTASVSASVGTKEVAVTMTIGPESSRSILVTTLRSTYTQMVTVVS